MSQDRTALDPTAYAVMILLTALWGFQQVTVKAIAAALLLLAWARLQGTALFARDRTLWPGLVAGFAGIVLAFWEGLGASRSTLIGDVFGCSISSASRRVVPDADVRRALRGTAAR